ncbi:winged helix-turn-helix transcriptional regulator [Luteimonas sp. SJ-92]|uniref:Winged helix-turn-helix transcriptional regulator n=1 Tax=Luteimonas salinisoli TaxID=2752307 RepID=A0A853J7B9_9GAMM|nr:MarR family winged helix-turn-helix transcriptional regulator [Luteimonas salinisoli]NZA24775.1 winged helix-turn-helix transcriptional regulator [Luteimonas salinisoli]
MTLTQDQVIAALQAALREFRTHHPDITAARILTLLAVARSPGIQQSEISSAIGDMSQAASSRNVLDWTELNSARQVGPDFIAQRPDPNFRKRNVLYLTPKGHAFLGKIASTVNARIDRRTS